VLPSRLASQTGLAAPATPDISGTDRPASGIATESPTQPTFRTGPTRAAALPTMYGMALPASSTALA
jgi:hypothetical protein